MLEWTGLQNVKGGGQEISIAVRTFDVVSPFSRTIIQRDAERILSSSSDVKAEYSLARCLPTITATYVSNHPGDPRRNPT